MVDPSTLIDNIISMQMSNATLLALLSPNPPESSLNPLNLPIFPYYRSDASATNFEEAIQEQPAGTLMVSWAGDDTARFSKNEAFKHDFLIYIGGMGSFSAVWAAFINGPCTLANNFPFRMSQVNPRCYPPSDMSCRPLSAFIGQGLKLYDFMAIGLSLIERGADT